jgi:hypothetical protein
VLTITVGDYIGDNWKGVSPQILQNADELLRRVGVLYAFFEADNPGFPEHTLASGWRSPERNARIPGAARQSTHMTGEGIDLRETRGNRRLARWCVANLHFLADPQIDLYMEDPRATAGVNTPWVHLQTRRTGSGARVFIPDANWAARLRGDMLDVGDIR